ncbi:MAG: uroporphyrinogen decarboxylase family protein [bacterium]
MAYSGVLEDIKACVNLGIPKKVPIFALAELFNVRMAGINYEEYTYNVDKLVKCEVEAVRRFDYDWVYLNPDDNMEFEPLGVKTKGEENVPLGAYEFLSASWDTLKTLKLPDFQRDGRMPAFLEAISRIKEELKDTICLCGRVAAPFSSVALLYGVEKALVLFLENPELFKKTADFFVELMSEWGKAQIQAGADAIWVGDCVASSGFISPKHYSEFAAEGALKLNTALKKDGALIFYHAGESSLPHLELMADTHPDALSIGGGIDIKEAKEALGKRVCLLGNIHGIKTLQRGSPEYVEKETIRIMESGKKNGGYIFNSEEGIAFQTPEQNIRITMQTAKKYGSYK